MSSSAPLKPVLPRPNAPVRFCYSKYCSANGENGLARESILHTVIFPLEGGCLLTLFAVGISPCGMSLAVLSSNRRMLVVNDIQRVINEDLPIFSAAVDVKIGREYGLPLCLTVTLDRIAVGTVRSLLCLLPFSYCTSLCQDTGILVLTLDRSRRAHGPRPYGSIRFCQSAELDLDPVRLSASFVQFRAPYSRMLNLEISGTKLLFNREPDTHALPQFVIPGAVDGCVFSAITRSNGG